MISPSDCKRFSYIENDFPPLEARGLVICKMSSPSGSKWFSYMYTENNFPPLAPRD